MIYRLSPARRRTARAPAARLTDGADRRMAKDHGRDVAVVQMLVRLVVKQALGDGDRRRRRLALALPRQCCRQRRKYLQCWYSGIYRQ